MLLVVASELDAHADAVISVLRGTGHHKIFRIDLETAHSRMRVRLVPDTESFLIESKGGSGTVCVLNEIKTIWWRRTNSQITSQKSLVPSEETLDKVETYWACRWMLESFAHEKFPLGHPNKVRTAQNKILQIRLASELGFKVPSTIFTNEKKAIREFSLRHPSLVIKPVMTTVVEDRSSGTFKSLYSAACSQKELRSLLEKHNEASLFCQERVFKKADIRVNVFPSCTVACRINTNGMPPGEVDWRPTTMDFDHEIISIPAMLDEQCRKFLSRLDLKWGAFDFALSTTDQFVFLECNPNGQWLWIELKTGFSLSKLVAEELLSHYGHA